MLMCHSNACSASVHIILKYVSSFKAKIHSLTFLTCSSDFYTLENLPLLLLHMTNITILIRSWHFSVKRNSRRRNKWMLFFVCFFVCVFVVFCMFFLLLFFCVCVCVCVFSFFFCGGGVRGGRNLTKDKRILDNREKKGSIYSVKCTFLFFRENTNNS